jgi:hypothetical protein
MLAPNVGPAVAPAATTSTAITRGKGQLIELFGSRLIGLWTPHAAVTTGANITSLPGLVGPTLADLGMAPLTLGDDGGYPVIVSANGEINQLGYTDAAWAAQTFLAVADGGTGASYETLAGGQSDTQIGALMRAASSGYWFESVGRTPHYVDGALTNAIPAAGSGYHICEGQVPSRVETGIGLGGNPTYGRGWGGRIRLYLQLSDTMSAGERAACNPIVLAMTGLP